jgi:urate oxidase
VYCRYTDGDNSRLITTDTIKNTVNILAKQNPVTPPELFASIVGTHFITFYPHINKSIVTIAVQRWSRMVVDGKPHPHSFLRDGTDTRNLEAEITEGAGISIRSSISGLMVLKSTGSAFHGFIKDEFTTLKETWDRVMSTEIECGWAFKHFAGLEAVKGATDAFDSAYESARNITLKTFAEELSESGQDAIYMMGERILEVVPLVDTVDYTLPNKHFFEIGKLLYDSDSVVEANEDRFELA